MKNIINAGEQESISSTFYPNFKQIFWRQSCVLGLKFFGAKILAKSPLNMLIKLILGVNFTNALHSAFTHEDTKRQSSFVL